MWCRGKHGLSQASGLDTFSKQSAFRSTWQEQKLAEAMFWSQHAGNLANLMIMMSNRQSVFVDDVDKGGGGSVEDQVGELTKAVLV